MVIHNTCKKSQLCSAAGINKLTSHDFYAHLQHMPSIMSDAELERAPAALNVMRQLLWVDSLVVCLDAGSPQAAAISKLCKIGQVVLLLKHGMTR